ncbi:hypothetical protein CP01DC11_1252, partial [Chlamydia psittaci 01DC11]
RSNTFCYESKVHARSNKSRQQKLTTSATETSLLS